MRILGSPVEARRVREPFLKPPRFLDFPAHTEVNDESVNVYAIIPVNVRDVASLMAASGARSMGNHEVRLGRVQSIFCISRIFLTVVPVFSRTSSSSRHSVGTRGSSERTYSCSSTLSGIYLYARVFTIEEEVESKSRRRSSVVSALYTLLRVFEIAEFTLCFVQSFASMSYNVSVSSLMPQRASKGSDSTGSIQCRCKSQDARLTSTMLRRLPLKVLNV